MEITVVLQLLLLVCCLSRAQVHTETGNEIIPHGMQTETLASEPANASCVPQTCPPDIHAVLREMSALLAEQRVEMRHLKNQNEAQAAELTTLKARSDTTENQVEALKRDREAQAAELITLKARSDITENQVEALKRDREVKQVAFSASLLASGGGHTGPYNTHTSLVFRHVTTNIGNAYNPHTGVFTAPVRGVYHFQFYVGANGHGAYPSAAGLVKNEDHIFIAYEHQTSGYVTSSNGVSLLLEVGDVVFLRLWQNSRIYDDGNHHSTFSGHLLFTM
ncbi:uncharacterized protein [Centroberyx affinis]|uniref:uncharacterized protein n=1 Tax=Centroberyx affinis TaxID=166261 RepID=UPI003A5BB3B3